MCVRATVSSPSIWSQIWLLQEISPLAVANGNSRYDFGSLHRARSILIVGLLAHIDQYRDKVKLRLSAQLMMDRQQRRKTREGFAR